MPPLSASSLVVFISFTIKPNSKIRISITLSTAFDILRSRAEKEQKNVGQGKIKNIYLGKRVPSRQFLLSLNRRQLGNRPLYRKLLLSLRGHHVLAKLLLAMDNFHCLTQRDIHSQYFLHKCRIRYFRLCRN